MGPQGPAGQPGAQGPAGPAGATNRLFYQAIIPTTETLFTNYLPAAASANNTLPSVQCYISDVPAGPYLQISGDSFNTCGIVRDNVGVRAVLQGDAGFYGSFVITY